jgi:predicted DNA-binding transcriptional regulator YafY
MQKTERLMAITLLLQARGKMTAHRLANILGVSPRTIYRDIVALSLAHVPVSMEYGPGGGYYLPDDFHLESAIFTREEAISLVLSADLSDNNSLFAGDDDLHRALVKLEAFLPEEYRLDVKAAREHIFFDTSAWYNSSEASPTYLETMRAAVLGSRQMDILYPCTTCKDYPGSGVLWRRIEPYGLVFKGISRRHIRTGRWYLVAYCLPCQNFDVFRVSDIEQLCVRKEPITPRPNFNLRSYWREARKHLEKQASPIVLTLHVTPVARYGLPGDITLISEEQDGSAIMRINFESIEAAISYALSLGADATVISPPQVREAVATTAQAIAEMYIRSYPN